MAHKDPLVSTIVPAFNAERYLGLAIDSILDQTYSNIEVLVVDNASTDTTAQVIKGYGDKVRYLREDTKGPAAARNRGLQESKGEYIAFLDSDDLWLPDKTERQVRFLTEHPEYGIVYSQYEYIDENGELYDNKWGRVCTQTGWVFEDLLRHELQIGIGTMMIRRSSLEEAGNFNEKLITAEDTDLFIRLAKYSQFGHIAGPVARYRSHKESLTKQQGVPRGTFKSLDYLVERYPELHPSKNSVMSYAYAVRHFARGRGAFHKGDYQETRRQTLKAIKYRPLWLSVWPYLLGSFVPAKVIDLVRGLKR